MTYVFITFIVLLFLNIYCANVNQEQFCQSKKSALLEKCQLATEDITQLDVLNGDTIAGAIGYLTEESEVSGSVSITRLLVVDTAGLILYDSTGNNETYALLPEIVTALEGYDVFDWQYSNGAIQAQAAMPIQYYGSTVGCIYLMEYDVVQGALIHSQQVNILQITLLLELIVIIFSIVFSRTFSRRLNKIMNSIHILREGDFSHKLNVGGNDELTALGDEFNDLTERLQTSEEKRRRFVSDASHELKTPLASIKLLSDSILQNDMDMDTVREFVGDIGDEAERLNRMTAKLLSLTKVDDEMAGESEIIYMTPTIQRAARRLSVIADQAGISLQLALDEDTPILILEDDLYQIVYNLIENGIKYNTYGGSLTVQISRDEDNAIIQFTDTGVGIPEDAIGHIFERFYRVDKARSRASGGSGLGLAIVRAIVQRNRGEITVASIPGMGTTFTVVFPAFDTEVDKS